MTKIVSGLDISKAKFDVSLFDGQHHQTGQFSNDEKGFIKFRQWLSNRGAANASVCMEATGRYWVAVATYLYKRGHDVAVLNPKIIKKYGESQLQRNKTDLLDAKLIARYMLKEEPYLWEPPAVAKCELQSLTRYLTELIEKRTREINQLKSVPPSGFVSRAMEETIAHLDEKIAETEAEIEKVREQSDELKQEFELLISIPGIADRSAALILAELPDLDRLTSAKQLAAYAGLTPQQLQSGNSRKERGLIKLGSKRLRNALYYPALVGKRFNPILKGFADNLADKGKAKMTIVGACMRKLLVLIYGILKNKTPFNPNYLVNAQGTA